MNWIDTGFLLSKNRYNENSIIAEIYTKNHGKCSGIIFGATSKKIKNYLQIGNKLHINYTQLLGLLFLLVILFFSVCLLSFSNSFFSFSFNLL